MAHAETHFKWKVEMTAQWRTPKIVSMTVYFDGNHEKKFDVGWKRLVEISYIMIKR